MTNLKNLGYAGIVAGVLIAANAGTAQAQTIGDVMWPDQLQGQGPDAQQQQGGRAQMPPGGPQRPNAAAQSGDIAPGDIQAMFEAMTVMEAERFVALTPEQFPVFVQRLKRLQEARAMRMRRHNRAMNELRGMANPQDGRADDATIDGKLRELAAIEVEGRTAIEKAMEAIDQMLSPRQRARFRMLEDNIEKKKFEFLQRVRQGRGGEPR